MTSTLDIKKWINEAHEWWEQEQKRKKEMGYMLEDLPESDEDELHFD